MRMIQYFCLQGANVLVIVLNYVASKFLIFKH